MPTEASAPAASSDNASTDPLAPDSGFSGSRDISELSLDELLGNASHIRFSINFFGDVAAVASSEDGAQPGFELGSPSLLLTADLGSNVHGLMEVAHDLAGGIVDIERLTVGWQGEQFSVIAGRIHSPLGYWNGRYHHGHWLMPTIDRPRVLDFEDDGGLYPVHQVGVFGGWQSQGGMGRVRFDYGIANGRPDLPTEVALLGDNNLAKSIVVTGYVQDVGARGLRLGVGFVYDRIAAAPASIRPALPNIAIDELIGNINVVYQTARLLLIGELYALSHTGGSTSARFVHGYALAGYRFGRTTPYVREELLAPKGNDPFYTPDPMAMGGVAPYGFSETIAGVRYNLSSWSAIKAEYRLEVTSGSPRDTIHRGIVDWSFGI